jgi:hypothetical protein
VDNVEMHAMMAIHAMVLKLVMERAIVRILQILLKVTSVPLLPD